MCGVLAVGMVLGNPGTFFVRGEGTELTRENEAAVDVGKLLDMEELHGWADTPGEGLSTTTGGGNVEPAVVSSLEQFTALVTGNLPRVIVVDGIIDTGGKAIAVGSNKTIVGKDENAQILGGIRVYNASNVIVANLNFNGGWPNGGPDDCIDVANSHHVWFHHLNIYNSYDGNLDIKMGADYITVSWCKLSYTEDANDGVAPDHDHRLSCLIGSGAGDHDDTDMNKLRVTYHHNWFSNNLDQRMPRVMYGRVHVYNNYYDCQGNSYCIGVDSHASTLIENNYFYKVNNPHKFMYPSNLLPAYIRAVGNEYDQTTGSKSTGQKKDNNRVKEFNQTVYDYVLHDAKDVPEVVKAYAGPKNDVTDKGAYSEKIESGERIEGQEDEFVPPASVKPLATQAPANENNARPIEYDKDTETYTYKGSNGQGGPAFYPIDNPFRGKTFQEDLGVYESQGAWSKGVTISCWVKVPKGARDAVLLSFNLENDRQMERKDAVKYNVCKQYSETDPRYSMGEVKTYVDAADQEYVVLTGDVGGLVQYNPNYPAQGCYRIDPQGGAICVREKGSDPADESNWTYLRYLGEGMYDSYGKRFDEEGGSSSRISEGYVSGSFCLYASGSMGFRQDNGAALQINPYLETYGNKIDIQTSNQLYYWGNGGYQSQAGSTFLTPTMQEKGKWHFVVAVIQNDWVQFYMDGKEMTDVYLTSWGASLYDKEGVAGATFNFGHGYRLKPNKKGSDVALTSMPLLDFISNENTVLTVGGKGASAAVLGQSGIGTPSGTMVKELRFYEEPAKKYQVFSDRVDFTADENTVHPTPTPAPPVLKGDVDGDGTLTLKDAATLLKMALGIEPMPEEKKNVADVNGDAAVDLADVSKALRMALNIE